MKNVYEELTEEIEKILDTPLMIKVKMKVKIEEANFCFKDLNKERIREALQKTIEYVMKGMGLKRFYFKDKELDNLSSLTLVFLRLTYAAMGSPMGSPWSGQINWQNDHLSKCLGCQMTLIRVIEHFAGYLIFKNLTKWKRTLIKVKIFLDRLKNRFFAPLIPSIPYFLSLYAEIKIFVNSEEKWEIFEKYLPLFVRKGVRPEKLLKVLSRTTKKKKKDLTPEEFEKTLEKVVK